MIPLIKLSGLCFLTLCGVISCSASNHVEKSVSTNPPVQKENIPTHSASNTDSLAVFLQKAEDKATPDGRHVLSMAKKMTLINREILPGGCWNYVDAVFNRAGYPKARRTLVFNGKKSGGPYANIKDIQAGDWLHFINHSYHDIEHSSIFVGWVDKKNRIGLMLSYAGERRKEPARYKEYDLSHVYKIYRASSNK